MSESHAAGRRTTVIVITVILLASAAAAAYIVWPRSPKATGTSAVSVVTAPPTIDAVDPPVPVPAAEIKPIAIAAGKVPTAAGIAKILKPVLANAGLSRYTGTVVDPANGKVLWNVGSTTASQPGSTAKLLTGAALLTKVKPTERFVTTIVKGPKDGDVVFVGGGDVTLSARSTGVATVYPGAATVAQLAAQVASSGYKVKQIYVDTRYWTGNDMADGWDPTDIQQGFTTRMQALMVDGDRTDPAKEASPRTGAPAVTAGRALARALGDANLPVSAGNAPKGATVLATVSSQPMSVLLSQALLNSDNVLAEALARQVSIASGGAPSFEGAAQAITYALKDLALDTVGLTLADGSGLSHRDMAPTSLLGAVMTMAVSGKVPVLRGLLAGLPVAGVTGTLSKAEGRFAAPQSKAGVGWVRAKTGTIDFTYALVGYVPDVDGRILVFALNSNGVFSSGPHPTRPAQDAFSAALRTCGCG